jgi:hypothetical protein
MKLLTERPTPGALQEGRRSIVTVRSRMHFDNSIRNVVLALLTLSTFMNSSLEAKRHITQPPHEVSGPRVYTGSALDSALMFEKHLQKSTLDLMVPEMIYPHNGDPTTIIPEFTLGSVTGADRYDLQVASDSIFSSIVSYSYWQFGSPTAAGEEIHWFAGIPSPGLFQNNTRYFWRIRAQANNGALMSAWSSTRSYVTTSAGMPLPAPVTTAPLDGSVNPWLQLLMRWDVVPGARYYQIQWSTSSSFSSFGYRWTSGSSSSLVDDFNPSVYYYWRILAYSDSTIGPFSAVGDFQTGNSIILTDASGSFDNGSGVGNYANSLDVSWLIKPPGAQQITLSFLSMDTESGYDFVSVYDGETASAPLLGRFSGNTLPSDISSTSGAMLVRFTTDYLTTYSGWAVGYSTSKSEPKIPIIIVPGIMGSGLFNDANGDGVLPESERSWVVAPRLNELQLAEDGISVPSNLNASILAKPLADYRYELGEEPFDYTNVPLLERPNPMRKRTLAFYEGLVAAVTTELGYTLHNDDAIHTVGEDLFIFTYDWRKHIADQGIELGHYIDQVKSWTGATQVKIIAHSMGGLLTKAAIRAGRNDIHTLVFLGTPHLGAPKSVYVSLTGEATEELAGFFAKIAVTPTVKHIARNFPSEYELYPSRKYADTYSNGSIAFIDDGISCNPLTYDDALASLRDRVVGSPPEAELNTGLLDAAKVLHESTDAAMDFGGAQVFNITAGDMDTGGLLRFFGNDVTLIYSKKGDGTVPLESADDVGTLSPWTPLSAPGVAHADLCNNPTSVDQVVSILRGAIQKPVANAKSSATEEEPTTYQVSARGHVALHAYDWFGRHTGPTSDSTDEANIPGSVYISGGPAKAFRSQVILLPRLSGYTIEMESSDTANVATLDVDDIREGRDVAFVSYRNLVLNEKSAATLVIDSVKANLPLSLDVTGDGSTVATVFPTRHVVNAVKEDVNLFRTIPSQFVLDQNYPNPFNPLTTIRYGLLHQSHVTLTVYNTLGQQVSVLQNGEQDAGYHEVKFDGKDLASGVYFYRIQAGSFVQTRTLLLLK